MKRVFSGIVLVILGVLALCQGIGVYDFGLSFWPVIGIVTGLWITYESFTGRRGPSWFGLALGLWLSAMGLFEILNDAGVTLDIDGGTIASAGWPILLIAIGLSVVFGNGIRVSVSGKRRHRTEWSAGRHQVVGDLRYGRSPWVLEKDLNLSNAVGDLRLDLTTADITPGLHRINVTQFVGETVIEVPENVTVKVTAEANVGELDILGDQRSGAGLFLEREIVVPDAEVQLIIDAHQRVGSLRVIRVPARPRRGIE